MARDDLGVRVEKIATKAVKDGRPAVEERIVGWSNKTMQLGAYVDPSSEEATLIAKKEAFVLMVGGKHELPIGKGADEAPEAVKVGDRLWIDPKDNSIKTEASEKAEGKVLYTPLGVVEEIDAVRKVALINTNALAAFLGA
jgi:hypothetical protein